MHTAGGSGEVTVATAMDCEELAPRVPGYMIGFSIEPVRVAERVLLKNTRVCAARTDLMSTLGTLSGMRKFEGSLPVSSRGGTLSEADETGSLVRRTLRSLSNGERA